MSSSNETPNAGADSNQTSEYDALNEKRFLAGVISYFNDRCSNSSIGGAEQLDEGMKAQCKQIAASIKSFAKLTDEHVDILAPQINAVEVFVSSPLSMPKEPYKALMVDIESKPDATDAEKRQAEELKQKGNEQLKENNALEAVKSYSEALKLDGKNPILYCNRAAAFTKANSFVEAVDDCKIATLLDAKYSKAYARMGTAFTSLKRFEEAKEAIQKAIELEPANDTYKNNLKIVEEEIEQRTKLSSTGTGGTPVAGSGNVGNDLKENFGGQVQDFGDFMNLMNNPQFMSYAQDMMKTPEFQERMATVMNAMMHGENPAAAAGMGSEPPFMPPGLMGGGAGGGFPGMAGMPGMDALNAAGYGAALGAGAGGAGFGGAGGGPDFNQAMMLGQRMFSSNPAMMEDLAKRMSDVFNNPAAAAAAGAGAGASGSSSGGGDTSSASGRGGSSSDSKKDSSSSNNNNNTNSDNLSD